MRTELSNTWFLQLFICFFFILSAISAYGDSQKMVASEIQNQPDTAKTYKIKRAQPFEAKLEPESGSEPESGPETRMAVELNPMRKRPKEIVFVLDNSGSMRKNDPNRITRDVVTNFIKNVDPESRLGMIIFGKTARVLKPLTGITEARGGSQFADSLKHLDYRGQLTNTPIGVERAIYEIKTNGKKGADKIIILLTDGIIDTGDIERNTESERWLKEDLVQECQDLGIKIFGIAFTDNADFRLMQILASKTGGEYFRVYRAEEIENVFNKIDEQLSATPPAKPHSVATASPTAQTERPVPRPKEEANVTQPLHIESPPQKMPKIQTEALAPDQSVSEAETSPDNRFADMFLTLSLITIILVVLILLLLIYKNSRSKKSELGPQENKDNLFPEIRPEVQAELIDVEHIIPQDSISLTIDKASVSIGRDHNCDIVIPEKVISSLHATITYRNGQYYLEDNRSTNGTRLNNEMIEQNTKVKLKSGDIIHFAKCEFRFLVYDQAPYGETMLIDAPKGDTA